MRSRDSTATDNSRPLVFEQLLHPDILLKFFNGLFIGGSFSNSIDSITYYVEAHVWSYATSLDTRVSDPTFSLLVDSYLVNGDRGWSSTFKPNGHLIYSLTFTTTDSVVAKAIGQAGSNYLILGMDALVSAGVYQTQVTVFDSATETF